MRLNQQTLIKKVIDLCDYYVLIIGKRYGSIHPETGKSYTEMEYDYAIEQGIPVLVFAIDDSVKLASDKIETDEDKKDKLKKFRKKAMTNRLASIWKSTDDLTGKLAISIMKAKTEIKRPGWQRAVDFDEVSSLIEQTDVAFENQEIKIEYYYKNRGQNYKNHGSRSATLKEIFKVISVEMLDVAISEAHIKNVIEHEFLPDGYERDFEDQQFVKKLLNQYRALDLLRSSWSDSRKNLFWGLTKKGRKVRDDMILIRKS